MAAHLFEQNTANSVAEAVRLVPSNSRYVARLAAWKPEERVELLQRAVDLNPFDSEAWIQLGLDAELDQNDPQKAEHYYLRAAAVDHMFQPKWTLTNFYFRRQNTGEFFRWAKATLAITPYSPDPVFAQMWGTGRDANRIGAAVPDRPGILLQYAVYLSNDGRLAAIPPVVERLIRTVGAGNPHAWGRDDLVAGIEDRLVSMGDSESALAVWTSMQQGGWIGESIPTAQSPLTNGDFATPFYKHGFDWTPLQVSGVEIDQFPERKSLRLSLSGEQPESCVLLRQYIPVEPGREYRMQWNATADRMESPSGLAWHLRPIGSAGAAEIVSGDILGPHAPAWFFKTPAAAKLCALTLEYVRPPGTVRASGSVTLQSVSLAAQ
jgi:tetratricopeptide (TPR) repeat protein